MDYTFAGPKAWEKITATIKKSGPRKAAVAFLGREAPSLMPLAENDVLVCNASDSALRSHSTSPDAISDYLSRGVEVWSSAALHAKVIATSKWAIVGSANASRHSAQRTNEAAIITNDSEIVSEVKNFVDCELAALDATEQITVEDLPRLRAVWNEGLNADPRFGVPGVNKSVDELISNPDAYFYICKDDTVDVDAATSSQARKAIRRGHATAEFAVDVIAIEADQPALDIGDLLFWWDQEGIDVPAVVIDIPRPALDDSDGRTYQAYRYRKDLHWLTWDHLRAELPAALWTLLDHDEPHIEGTLADTTPRGAFTKQARLARALLQLWGLAIPDPI